MMSGKEPSGLLQSTELINPNLETRNPKQIQSNKFETLHKGNDRSIAFEPFEVAT
jgi:hypothetical protein